MGQLVNGRWVTDDLVAKGEGAFVRAPMRFRNRVTADGTSRHPAEVDRYHLYVSLACPWAHRTLIFRKLKKLEHVISLSIVDPFMGADGWHFSDGPGCIPDSVLGSKLLRDVYLAAQSDFSGRVTVPVLWDKKEHTIVNNESLEIIEMLDREFDAFGDASVHFFPDEGREAIDEMIALNYDSINNGVYRSGFAGGQEAHEHAVREVFEGLDECESNLSKQRYLCGSSITAADWCLFTTLYRFDSVYYVHFKCNVRRIIDYPNLWGYLRELVQTPGVAETCNMDHIKRHYYQSHTSLNPRGIVPIGPDIDMDAPHDRERLTPK